jgi:metallo-beta-lactamase family protein
MRPSRSAGALCEEINQALAAGGNLLIPAFAVERTQELLHDIGVLMAKRQIKDVPVFLDSPLANDATKVFAKHAAALEDIALEASELFRNPNFRFVESVDESKSLNGITGGAIIIAASGMCEAGRIRHHLKNNLWRAKATVLFVGYQAPGTLGRLILDGEKSVSVFGEEIAVSARIREIGNYSAHADQKELVDWMVERQPVHGGMFLTHGEDQARAALREQLSAAGLAKDLIHLPRIDDRFELVAAGAPAPQPRRARIPDSEIARDWHNEYAVLLLDLSRQLERLPSDHARRELLRRLRAELPR